MSSIAGRGGGLYLSLEAWGCTVREDVLLPLKPVYAVNCTGDLAVEAINISPSLLRKKKDTFFGVEILSEVWPPVLRLGDSCSFTFGNICDSAKIMSRPIAFGIFP